jgi:hypothetical protein
MAKRSPEEVLNAIDAWDQDDAIDEEMARVLAMTPEERESELRAAGVDVEAERVKAREWPERAGAGEGRGEARERTPTNKLRAAPRRNVIRFLTPLAAALAGLLVVMVVVGRLSPSHDYGSTAPKPGSRADQLRETGFAACDAQRWKECLQKLDEARKVDPDGEREARVHEYRQRAEAATKEP